MRIGGNDSSDRGLSRNLLDEGDSVSERIASGAGSDLAEDDDGGNAEEVAASIGVDLGDDDAGVGAGPGVGAQTASLGGDEGVATRLAADLEGQHLDDPLTARLARLGGDEADVDDDPFSVADLDDGEAVGGVRLGGAGIDDDDVDLASFDDDEGGLAGDLAGRLGDEDLDTASLDGDGSDDDGGDDRGIFDRLGDALDDLI